MTIWKAIAIGIRKLTEGLVILGQKLTPCSHTWQDYQLVRNMYGKAQIGQSMVQRCTKCSKFRQQKIF